MKLITPSDIIPARRSYR